MKQTKRTPFRAFTACLAAASLVFTSAAASTAFAAEDTETMDFAVDLTSLTCASPDSAEGIKTYTRDDYETFLSDRENGSLPEIYITEFVYDGIGMVQKVSLDDETGEVEIKKISDTVINVNTTGNIEFTGSAEDTMIAVDTNGVEGDIDLYLNGVTLESSKKTPAIMVYNKDTSYDGCKVTIKTVSGTENYITGGKLKKVSTMLSENLSDYTAISSAYSDTSSSYYYYFENERDTSDLSNLLFAVDTADSDKISEGSPYTYYKYSGAISSDIDLYFEGSGYLEVASKSDEGIETKADIILQGGTGDYKITAYDDCLNASADGADISVDVNSLTATVLVDEEEDEETEGDAFDSNGTLHINGGMVTAIAHPTSGDSGLDSDMGTYINGGTVIATGNMYDTISDESEQEFISLSFAQQKSAGTVVSITDTDGNEVFSYTSDRTFTNIVYSSPSLSQGTYYVYCDGVKQQYSGTAGGFGGGDGQMQPGGNGDGTTTPPEKPDGDNGTTPPEKPDGSDDSTTPPELPDNSDSTNTQPQMPDSNSGNSNSDDTTTPPEKPDGDDGTQPQMPDGGDGTQPQIPDGGDGNTMPSIEFTISDTTHAFSNVSDFTYTLGDVNFDGTIDITDVTLIQKGIAQIAELTGAQQAAADVNGDGVDITDATEIQKYIAKIITEFSAAK